MNCPTGKIRFKDKISAELAKVSARKNDLLREKIPVRSYFCPSCKGWHMTSRKGGR